MSLLWPFLLGIVQGLTEFLPISSSGHLVLVQQLFNLKEADLFLDICLHIGSLVAIVYFFRQSLISLAKRTIQALRLGHWQDIPSEIWLVLVASLPAFLIGVIFHDAISTIFNRPQLLFLAFGLTGLFLWSTKEKKDSQLTKKLTEMSWTDGLVIGLFQAVAILPGVSRSGSTFTGGLWRYLSKETAFYFSFLISIPAILGAFGLELVTNDQVRFGWEGIVGLVSSAVFSLLGLSIFRQIIRRHQVYLFSFYCFFLSLLSWWLFH
jgi:undecaprenyl-diphosphatase